MRAVGRLFLLAVIPALSWWVGVLTMMTLVVSGPADVSRALARSHSEELFVLMTGTVIVGTPAVYALMFGLRRITLHWWWFVILGASAGVVAGFWSANNFAGLNLERDVRLPFNQWFTSVPGFIGAWTGGAAGAGFGADFAYLFCRR